MTYNPNEATPPSLGRKKTHCVPGNQYTPAFVTEHPTTQVGRTHRASNGSNSRASAQPGGRNSRKSTNINGTSHVKSVASHGVPIASYAQRRKAEARQSTTPEKPHLQVYYKSVTDYFNSSKNNNDILSKPFPDENAPVSRANTKLSETSRNPTASNYQNGSSVGVLPTPFRTPQKTGKRVDSEGISYESSTNFGEQEERATMARLIGFKDISELVKLEERLGTKIIYEHRLADKDSQLDAETNKLFDPKHTMELYRNEGSIPCLTGYITHQFFVALYRTTSVLQTSEAMETLKELLIIRNNYSRNYEQTKNNNDRTNPGKHRQHLSSLLPKEMYDSATDEDQMVELADNLTRFANAIYEEILQKQNQILQENRERLLEAKDPYDLAPPTQASNRRGRFFSMLKNKTKLKFY